MADAWATTTPSGSTIAASASPVLNGLDHLEAMTCKVEIVPWAPNSPQATPAWMDIGEADGIFLKWDTKANKHKVDNAKEVLDERTIEEDVEVGFEIVQASLANMQIARGGLATDMKMSGSGTTAAAELALGPVIGDKFWSVRFTIANQYMQPLQPGGGIYTGRTYGLWKVHFTLAADHKLILKGKVTYPYKGTVIRDTSVAASVASPWFDQYGFVHDQVTPSPTLE